MILVTGGFGFVGSNVARALVAAGHRVAVVDNLQRGDKVRNLDDVPIDNYWDVVEFEQLLRDGGNELDLFDGVVHLGARTDTTETDGRLLMQLNFSASRRLVDACAPRRIPFVYASSAAVYGQSAIFVEERKHERPLNAYGYSKLAFDDYVRARSDEIRGAIGLRFFNVYGRGEAHKGAMASVVARFFEQLSHTGSCQLFGESHGFAAGCQQRDFVHVDDVTAVVLWSLSAAARHEAPAIVNVGTGVAATFLSVAELIRSRCPGAIEFIDFPELLAAAYQPYTCADLTRLRELGCEHMFRPVDVGVAAYVDQLLEEGQ